jgi:hypothetical protein
MCKLELPTMSVPQKQRGRSETYDASLKIAVARDYLTSNLGFTKLAQKYNLPGEATARYFLKWYQRKYPEGTVVEVGKETQKHSVPGRTEADLKITALEMLIENASKELGIDLVKKFGTKQPKK